MAGDRIRRADADLTLGRIGEEVDILHALAQIIEDRDAALGQRLAVGGRDDAAAAAIDQLDGERIFQLDDRLGDRGLRDREPPGGLAHAAGLDDREQDIEVAQFQPAFGAVVPGHGRSFHLVMS
jgi:hypothetical protein